MTFIIIGFIISLSSELLNILAEFCSIPLEYRFPKFKIKWVKITFHSLALVGIIISLFAGVQSEKDSSNTRRYQYYANLDVAGNELISNTIVPTDISDATKDIVTYETYNGHNRFKISCADSNFKIFDSIINKFPDFPFGYAYKAMCLKEEKKDDSWKPWAQKAIEIFKITKTFSGHAPEHDMFLKNLQDGLLK